MNYAKLIFLILFLGAICGERAYARQCGQAMSKARDAYEIGRFDEAIGLLRACLKDEAGFDKQQRIAAYRILTVSYIELDSTAKALNTANDLINLEPGFATRPEDPLRFQQMVADIRRGLLRKLISSVSKTNESLAEAPATVVVVDEEQIAQRGYQSLIDLLADLPGFDITIGNGPAYAMLYQRGYRSIVTDRTLFLVDGVEENDLSANTAYISRQLSISNIKRVEVIYGPTSTMYGPNASVGVINVITKDGDDMMKAGNDIGVRAEASYGTYNTKNIDATVSGRYKNIVLTVSGRRFVSDENDLSQYDAWNYDLLGDDATYASHLAYKGSVDDLLKYYKNDSSKYYTIQDGKVVPTQAAIDYARQRDRDSLSNIAGTGQAAKYTNETNNWGMYAKLKIADVTLGYHTWRRNEGTLGWYNNKHAGSDNGEAWNVKNSFVYLKYEKAITDNLSVTLFTRYKAHELDDRTQFIRVATYSNGGLSLGDLLTPDDPNNTNNPKQTASWRRTYFYRLSKQLRNELRVIYTGSKINAIFGAEFRNSLIQGDYINSSVYPYTTNSGEFFNQRDIGFYIQGSYIINSDLKLTLGGRVDDNKVRNDDLNTVFNPRVALVYSPKQFIFKAIYATAFKEASNLTKYATTDSRKRNNPKLKPEIVHNYELSAHWENTDNSIITEVSVYLAQYSGIVGVTNVAYNGGTTQQFNNIGNSEIKGLQATFTYKYDTWDFYGNYSFTDPRNTRDEDGDTNERIADIAAHRINMGANYQGKIFNFNGSLNYVGQRETPTSIAGINKPVPAYTILNTSISYRPPSMQGLQLQMTIQNLTDLEYVHPGVRDANGDTYAVDIPQYGRRITLKGIYSF